MSAELPEKIQKLLAARELVSRLTEEIQQDLAKIGITVPWTPVPAGESVMSVIEPKRKRKYTRRAAPAGAHIVPVPSKKKRKAWRPISPAQRQSVIDSFKQKKGVTEIERLTKVSHATVYKILHEENLLPPVKKKK